MNTHPLNNPKRTLLMLAAGSALALALLYFRMEQSHTSYYRFFIWNLLLAWIPLLLSFALVEMDRRNMSAWMTWFVLGIWLLFFPNAPYMLTDLVHLKPKHTIPVWYDLGMMLAFAWNGAWLGFVSLLGVQAFIRRRTSGWITWTAICIICLLAAFGIYIGRYERLNSWDLFTQPFALIAELGGQLVHPLAEPKTLGVTLLFGAFLLMAYTTLYVLIDVSKPVEHVEKNN